MWALVLDMALGRKGVGRLTLLEGELGGEERNEVVSAMRDVSLQGAGKAELLLAVTRARVWIWAHVIAWRIGGGKNESLVEYGVVFAS